MSESICLTVTTIVCLLRDVIWANLETRAKTKNNRIISSKTDHIYFGVTETAVQAKQLIVRILAQTYGARIYHRDEHQHNHLLHAAPEKYPNLHKAWVNRESKDCLIEK